MWRTERTELGEKTGMETLIGTGAGVIKNGQKRVRIQSIKDIEKHIGNHIVLYLPKIADNTYKHSVYMPVC